MRVLPTSAKRHAKRLFTMRDRVFQRFARYRDVI
jgi:hypothetical protein